MPRELVGVILFLGCEAMFFAALFTTYFYLRGRLPEWQPVFGEKPTWLGLPALLTLALGLSSLTVELAVRAIARGAAGRLRAYLVATMALGAIFLGGQLWDFAHLGFRPQDGIFASVFFLLTGFHGAHVAGGLLLLLYCTVRAFLGHWTQRRHLAVRAAALYWQFVDVIWLGLFVTVYVIG